MTQIIVSISHDLESFTAENSGYETRRDYISLSNIAKSEDELIKEYVDGFQDSHLMRLKCYKGYQMERDLLKRIFTVFPDRVNTGPEIVHPDSPLIKGHPDFTFDEYPGDCKAVPMDDHLPKDGKLPRKVYWQLQGYMKYMNKEKALCVYESRESGMIRDWWIRENATIQKEIAAKCDSIIQRLGAFSKQSA